MQSREAGLRGEQAAAEWLIANGFELLHRNWRSGRYELDIVALREGVLHVVEVKCRRSGALSPPEEAMTPRKFAALMRAAEHYVALYGFDTDTQFDLVTVEYRPDGECDPALFSECDDTALVTDRAERTLAALAFEPDGSRSFGRPFGRARIRNAFRLSAKIPGPEVFCLLSAGGLRVGQFSGRNVSRYG